MSIYNFDHNLKRENHFNIDDIVYLVKIDSKNTNAKFIPKENGNIVHSISGEHGVVKYDTIDVFKIVPVKIQGLVREYEDENDSFNYFYYDNLEEEMIEIPQDELFINIEEAKSEILKHVKEYDIKNYIIEFMIVI